MQPKRWILLFAVVFLLTASTLSTLAADSSVNLPATSKSWEIDVILRSQIYLPTPRPVQDVFIVLNSTTPNLVYRIERGQADNLTNLAKEVYATINATPHDPYKVMPKSLGPFPKGADLGFTLGQWLAAIGTGTYTEENDNATMNFTFKNLVPNGTYTVHYTRITMPPNYNEVLIPVGATDGSQNTFKADAKGNAAFNLKLKALPASTNISFKDYAAMYVAKTAPITTNVTWTLISVAYHSDGKTHGASLGELGKNAHVQMLHLMYPKPYRTYQEWKNATTVATTSQGGMNTTANATMPPTPATPGFEGSLAVLGLSIGYIALRRY